MTDNIKSLVERLRSPYTFHDKAAFIDQLKVQAADLIEQQAARIAELESTAQPYAYELHLPNDEYSLVYAAYLAKYATAEERACERIALYAHPVSDSAMAKLFEVLMQQNIVTSDESYLSLKCVGVPPTEAEFVSAVQRAIAASEPKKEPT